MEPTTFLDGRVALYAGDCRDRIKEMPDNSVDSVVTDPPYALVSIQKRFGKPGSAATKDGDVYARSSAGFMGKQWDTGETAFAVEFWAEVFRVLKPGGHVVAFSGTRTYHRMACAIEDAGFEIRDQIGWLYGSGFPKSHNIGKALDKMAGAEREVIGTEKVRDIRDGHGRSQGDGINAANRDGPVYMEREITAPATEAAREWQGWGTALKPAWEPICLARKPLIGTVAENVLEHGTGALNIDGCRVGTEPITIRGGGGGEGTGWGEKKEINEDRIGRFPANIVHDGSDEVLARFPDRDGANSNGRSGEKGVGNWGMGAVEQRPGYADSGSAARFFYTAKADKLDRIGSKHPTVKPVDLMQWLVRLVTPKGGLVLDPFAGTGTTGEAAWREGFKAILIEREAEYHADITRRMDLVVKPTKRAAVAKSKGNLMGAEGTPLFGGEAA